MLAERTQYLTLPFTIICYGTICFSVNPLASQLKPWCSILALLTLGIVIEYNKKVDFTICGVYNRVVQRHDAIMYWRNSRWPGRVWTDAADVEATVGQNAWALSIHSL